MNRATATVIDIHSSESPRTDHRQELLIRLYQQSKQISQIVSYIWRWVDGPSAEKAAHARALSTYFTHPTERGGEQGSRLKKLFGAAPKADGNVEERLLHAVFAPVDDASQVFPIFSEFELGNVDPTLGYLLEIDLNSFQGMMKDPTKNMPDRLPYVIPYPPRPQLGEGALTTGDLDTWISDRTPNKFFADNVYIPTSCS